VDDPDGFREDLISDLRLAEDQLDLWLIDGAERFKRDAEVSRALLRVARHDDSRRCLKVLGEILETPGLMDRFLQVLAPGSASASAGSTATAPKNGRHHP
jgi:hypothetical protein